MDELSVRVVPPDPEILPPQDWDLICSWSRQFFGSHPLSARLTWVAKEGVRYRVLVYSGQQLVSHLRIIERSLNFDRKDVLACGIGGVMTAPGHHGRGFASMALRESERIIFDEIGADIGVLLCLLHLVPFYAKRRWQVIECPLEIDQPTGREVWPECAMLLPKPRTQFTPKTFNLGGLPF
jgi:Acetyltransferase (GNAT) domain